MKLPARVGGFVVFQRGGFWEVTCKSRPAPLGMGWLAQT